MASSPLECDVCCNVFSADNYPRLLPCSHKFCGPCIDGIIATQKKTCPSCREEFTATSAEDFTIWRSLLDVVEKFGPISVQPKTLSKGAKGSFLGFTKESEEKSTKDSTADVREAETKRLQEMKNLSADIEILSEMRASVIAPNKRIEGSVEKLQQIKLSNEKILDSVNEDIKCLKNKMILILQEEGKTKDAKAKEGTAIDSTSSGLVMDDTKKVLPEGQEKVKRNEGLHQETQRQKNDIVKEIIKTRTQLENVAEEMQKAFEVDPLVIFAVKVVEGMQMVAPVRVKPENQVCLSHFAEGDIPPKSLIIKNEALMDRSSRRAFLDLALEGTSLGRIIFKVKDEGHLALNFLHLCAGDLGPSYADSPLSVVFSKGQDGERISVDGYITSGENTETPIIKQIDWNKEKQREIYKHTPHKAGEVRGSFSNETGSCFYIVTRDDPKWSYNNCFGIVEEGLDALRDAILQYPDITAVRIVDCGLMFPL